MLSRTYWAGVVIFAVIVVSAITELGLVTAALTIGAVAFVAFVPLRSVLPETRRLAQATGTRRWIWLVGVALFAGGVGLMHVLGDPVYHVECPTRAYRGCKTGHNWGTIAYFTGIAAGVIAASTYPAYNLVKRGHETTAASVRPGDVVVSGTVVPLGGPLEAPFTGEKTVCHRYAVQERHNSRLFSDDGSWHTVAVGEESVPFYVQDETGRVLVDPESAALTLNELTAFGAVGDVTREAANDSSSGDGRDGNCPEAEHSNEQTVDADESLFEGLVSSGRVYQVDAEVVVGPDDAPPDRIADWEQRHGGLLPIVPREKRYMEDQLQPGDTVTVAGRADTFAHGYPERTVIGGDGAPAKISAGKRQHVVTHLTGAVWIGGLLSILLTPVGLGVMLWTL